MAPAASKLSARTPSSGKKKARKTSDKAPPAAVGTATAGLLMAGGVLQPTPSEDHTEIGTSRTKNFNHDEDLLLSMAWVALSADPIKGCNQKGSDFWASVLKHYGSLQRTSTVEADVSCKRDWKQLQTRFNRHIQPLMNKFTKHYRWAYYNLPSGVPKTVENYIKYGKQSFFLEYKLHFKMDLCVPVLQKSPRFDPFVTSIDVDSSGPGATVTPSKKNNVGAGMMGATHDRPMGCKAAKAQKRQTEGTERELSLMRQEISLMGKTIEKRSAVADLARLAVLPNLSVRNPL
jgi:hypothetical protein